MIKENKVSKYMLYAIGEIVLVVIGILIALQVNAWNQERNNLKQERETISNLNKEFKQNKIILNQTINIFEKCYQTGDFLISLVGKEVEYLKKHNIDSLLDASLDYYKFSPSENVIKNLIQSGKLDLIKNDSLKGLIYSWSRINIQIHEGFEDIDDNTENNFVKYLMSNYSLKDMDHYSFIKRKDKSNLSINKLKIFENIEFENILENHLYYVRSYINDLEKTETIINAILIESSITQSND